MSIYPNHLLDRSGVLSQLPLPHSIELLALRIYQQPIVEDMQFPQSLPSHIKQLTFTDVEQLENCELAKYRRYLQLKPGLLDCKINEIKLDGVILGRERLNLGMQIEAAPPKEIVPIAALLSNTDKMRFCGSNFEPSHLMQACGNEWQLYTDKPIDYVCGIFMRETLEYHTQQLTGKMVPSTWFCSQVSKVEPLILDQYKQWLVAAFWLLEQQPQLLSYPRICHQLSGQIFSLAVKLLTSSEQSQQKVVSKTRRIMGVSKVVEYLKYQARELPTITQLCNIANLSERSLEYGFKEQFGVTPIRYLKLVRLNGAHQDLYLADPTLTRVADVALYWGFVEFGRFSGEYFALFNEKPSQTLRR
jgi:AraC family ethanolamine operon transcriptional activator